MAKKLPAQIRSGFLVKNGAPTDGFDVTVFVAEKTGDDRYSCYIDNFVAATADEIANDEIGLSSGADFLRGGPQRVSFEKAVEWLAKKESAALATGKYTPHAFVD